MGKPKGILQVLWERVFMDTSKDVCTYFALHRQEDNYDYWYKFKGTDSKLPQIYKGGDTT